MKQVVLVLGLCSLIFLSCKKESSDKEKFAAFISRIPQLPLPFGANSYKDLQSELSLDTIFKKYNDENASEIYGKVKINDSIYGVVYLLAGDNVFPKLVTYNAIGKKIAELNMVNCPGGSTGYNESGSSYMIMNRNFEIQITDSVESFERDSLDEIMDSSRKLKIINERYFINFKGEILKITSS
ncbi:MAG: hypothetical protein V4677_08675 [Bacteroidota bacterium]